MNLNPIDSSRFASSDVRAMVPGILPYSWHFFTTLRISSRILGFERSSRNPSDIVRSVGPTNAMSTPLTARMASMFSSASLVST